MRPTIVFAIACLLGTPMPAQGPPATFTLPAPAGKSPVGTTRWLVADPSRQETFAPGRTREVEVIAWYPSEAGATGAAGAMAPYLRNGVEEVLSLARLAKLGDAYNGLASVKTQSLLDAPPAKTPARFPVIVFSHGYTGLPSSHTALFEDLASHGWAVLHVVHPYEAASTLSDGTFVTFTDENNAMRAGIVEVLKEWGPEGATIDKVVAATDDAEKENLLRGYFGQEILGRKSVLLTGDAQVPFYGK